jgi:hypothetical protein
MLHEMSHNTTQFEEKKIDVEIQDLVKNTSSTESDEDKEDLSAEIKLGSIANTLIDATKKDKTES